MDWCSDKHQWRYLDGKHRICKECGICEIMVEDDGKGWEKCSFDELMRSRKWKVFWRRLFARVKHGKSKEERDREKAKAFLREENR